MAEIEYSKGPREAAKVQRRRVSKDLLRDKAARFFLQDSNHPSTEAHNVQEQSSSDAIARLGNAVQCGNFAAVLFILNTFQHSLKLKSLDYLLFAVESDSLAVVSLLLQHRVDLEDNSSYLAPQDRIDSALITAIRSNYAAAVRLLLEEGANKNARHIWLGDHESTCYGSNLDPTYGHVRSIRLKITYWTPLAEAISLGHHEIARILLKEGAAVNTFPIRDEMLDDYEGFEPPLNVAIRCFSGRPYIPLLLKNGANVNDPFQNVYPLCLAIYHFGKTFRCYIFRVRDSQ